MTELSPAKVRVEIFREPLFFDDHFCIKNRAWALTSVGTSSISKDGKTLTVNSGDQTYGSADCDCPDFLSTGAKAEIRVISLTAGRTWRFNIYYSGAWHNVGGYQNGVGLIELTLPSGYTVTKIQLTADGAACTAVFDYVAITKYSPIVPDMGDLVEELSVTRPLLNNAISGAKLSIPNTGGTYNGLIKNHDVILIWIARDSANLGEVAYKAFGGRVVTPTNRGEKYGDFYIDLDCHGHAYELDIPPALLQKIYVATAGRTIIEEALSICNYLTSHPLTPYWFDKDGSSGSTDDRIGSTHDAVYDEEIPMIVIREILEKAKNPSAVQGFDAYETPDGCIIGHLRNSLDFLTQAPSIYPDSYQKSDDLHRVINNQIVYGAFGGQIPSSGHFTDSLDYWDAPIGTLSYVAPSYIRCDKDGSDLVEFGRTMSPFEHISGLEKTSPLSAGSIWFKAFTDQTVVAFVVFLLAPDDSNYFYQTLSVTGGLETNAKLKLGEDQGWSENGSPNWNNIKQVRWTVQVTAHPFYVYIHELKFIGSRFRAVAEDSASQTSYGVRTAKPIIDDALTSNAECQAKADSIISVQKVPVATLSDIHMDGDHRYNPGDSQEIIVVNDSLAAFYRIVQIRHSVKETVWDMVITLSHETQQVDYVFKLFQEAQKLLERRG